MRRWPVGGQRSAQGYPVTRTLFLHIGPAKTATSAVQHVLRGHDNSVVLYPQVGLWSDGSHHNLVFNFFGDHRRPETTREDADALFAQIAAAAEQSGRNIVISSEALPGRDIAAFANALLQHLGGTFRVQLVAVVREHLERAASLYGHRVMDGFTAESCTPDEFLSQRAHAFAYSKMLTKLGRTGFDVTALNYHPSDGCVERVLAHFGFPKDSIPVAQVRHPSPGTTALAATLALNRTASTPQARKRIARALRAMPGFFGPARAVFSRGATEVALLKLRPDRKFLADRFAIVLPEPELPGADEGFGIDDVEFEEIARATSRLGSEGAALRECVRTFIR